MIVGSQPIPLDGVEPRTEQTNEGLGDAAEQFEALLLRQLWQAMRKTVGGAGFGGGSGAGAGTYMHFLDDAVATQLTSAGGIGLRSVLVGEEVSARPGAELAPSGPRAHAEVQRRAPVEIGPLTGVRRPGATGALQRAARDLLNGPSAQRFGRDGRLTAGELSSRFSTVLPSGERAAFNVHDAAGFEGEYKCNLFAFELGRRAGFQTPVQGRRRGWGYPSPDAVAADAADGRLRRDWGRVATGESAEALAADADAGQRAFMLAGAGSEGHAGHMAVVERVHAIRYDEHGEIAQIEFDGWEARSRGARHLSRRTWNRVGTRGGNDARSGLSRIEIIELLTPRGGSPEMPLTPYAGPSIHDAPHTPPRNQR
ncbi:MAG: hypothetical protein AAF938_03325 [Myxococcota bacterium]